MTIDWEAVPCRHERCQSHAVGIYYVPEGCNCFPDPVQALCEQHFIKLHSTGPITTIVSWRTEMDARTELRETQAELARERNKLYQLRAEALKFTNVREATQAYNEMLERSQELQGQLEDTRGIIREMLRFVGEAFEKQEDRYGTAFPVTSVPDPGDGSACGTRELDGRERAAQGRQVHGIPSVRRAEEV
jgi:hypothetical protein